MVCGADRAQRRVRRLAGGSTLVGMAGLHVPDTAKLRHKGVLGGMYVRPEVRGAGLAAALVACVVEQARGVVERRSSLRLWPPTRLLCVSTHAPASASMTTGR